MDTNIQLTRPAGTVPGQRAPVRFAKPDDAPPVKALAATAFVYGRFHCDPEIGHETAAKLKAEWAGNYFSGKRGDRMIVSEDDQGIGGFLQLLTIGDETVIDLIAVDARCRNKGVARSMIALAAGDGRPMRVGTPVANTPSLALYEKLGFRLATASYVLHLHLSGSQ